MYTPAPTTTHGLAIPPELIAGTSSEPDMKHLHAGPPDLPPRVRPARRCRRRGPTGARAAEVAEAIEAQIATMVRSLHNHHHGEDTRMWPHLRERDPAAAVVLDALEAEHQEIDPLIEVISDGHAAEGARRRPGAAVGAHQPPPRPRGGVGAAADSPPLQRRRGEADGKAHLKETRADLPMFVCIMFDHMTEQEIAETVASAPKILGWMYKLSWRRAYAKRRELVYGY